MKPQESSAGSAGRPVEESRGSAKPKRAVRKRRTRAEEEARRRLRAAQREADVLARVVWGLLDEADLLALADYLDSLTGTNCGWRVYALKPLSAVIRREGEQLRRAR